MGMSHLVMWVLGSITINKTGGGDGIPAELIQILKDDAVEVLHSTCQQMWKTQQWPQDWKRRAMLNVKTAAQLYSFYMLARLCSNPSS